MENDVMSELAYARMVNQDRVGREIARIVLQLKANSNALMTSFHKHLGMFATAKLATMGFTMWISFNKEIMVNSILDQLKELLVFKEGNNLTTDLGKPIKNIVLGYIDGDEACWEKVFALLASCCT